MNVWPHKVPRMSREEIDHAVDDFGWQSFRRHLKGMTTRHKLKELNEYLLNHPHQTAKVRVGNYINALLRGGQLVHKRGEIWVQR